MWQCGQCGPLPREETLMMSTRHVLQIPSEDVIQEIESTNNCIINRHFDLPWFHSKRDPPQVGHIYSEIGQGHIPCGGYKWI